MPGKIAKKSWQKRRVQMWVKDKKDPRKYRVVNLNPAYQILVNRRLISTKVWLKGKSKWFWYFFWLKTLAVCSTVIELPVLWFPYFIPTKNGLLQCSKFLKENILLIPIRFSQLSVYTFDFTTALSQLSARRHLGLGGRGDCCGRDWDSGRQGLNLK